MDKLIAALIVLLLALIAFALWMYNAWKSAKAKKAAQGTIPGGSTPGQATIRDRWSTAPTTVTAGVDTRFVLKVVSAQATGLVAVSGREYIFQAPSGVTIVSVSGAVAGNPNIGTTDAAGTITIVIRANAVEQPTQGALVTQQVTADQSTAISAPFTVQ